MNSLVSNGQPWKSVIVDGTQVYWIADDGHRALHATYDTEDAARGAVQDILAFCERSFNRIYFDHLCGRTGE